LLLNLLITGTQQQQQQQQQQSKSTNNRHHEHGHQSSHADNNSDDEDDYSDSQISFEPKQVDGCSTNHEHYLNNNKQQSASQYLLSRNIRSVSQGPSLSYYSGATSGATGGVLTHQSSQEQNPQGSPLHLLDIPPPTPAVACNSQQQQQQNNIMTSTSVPMVAVNSDDNNTALTPVLQSPVSKIIIFYIFLNFEYLSIIFLFN
jgi:hypothetical protein